MRTKLQRMIRHLGVLPAVASLALLSGCGGGSSANVITVSVSPTGVNVIVGTTLTLTATEGGVTTQMVTWTCNFTTQAATATKPSAQMTCDSVNGAVGKITNPQPTTVVYNAPTAVPDPTKFPGLIILITATATADTKKTNSAMLSLDSGISFQLNPVTATVPTKEQEQFRIQNLTNDTKNLGVTWLITQTAPTSTMPATPLNALPTCSPGCGMIDPKSGLYTAPATVPPASTTVTTPSIVTLVVFSNADNTRVLTGTITIVAGGPITFNSISPNFAPQGAAYWDIYLDAPGISSSSKITIKDPAGSTKPIDSADNPQQMKVLFPVPTTATPAPTSTGMRIRLSANASPPDLASPGTYTITVTDSAETVTAAGPLTGYQFTVVPVRATSTATVPDGFNQGDLTNLQASADGGYFGTGSQFVNLFFNGNLIPAGTTTSDARHLSATFSTTQLDANVLSPGLYPLSIGRTKTPFPALNNPSVTNLSLFPDYSVNMPTLLKSSTVAIGGNPSAIDIDTKLGVVVVAEATANAVQFYRIASQTDAVSGSISDSLVPIDYVSGQDCTPSPLSTTCPATGVGGVSMSLPTGLSVNSTNHTVAVVNYGSQTLDNQGTPIITGQTVMDFPIPVPGASPQNPAITPFAIDISNILQKSVSPAPMAYAIGVDPDSNLALVAYSSVSTSAPANLGFVLNLNSNTQGSNTFGCNSSILPAPSPSVGQCAFSEVTLNAGVYPQIAMAPHGHLAVVTPGGNGVVRGVDVTMKQQNSSNLQISSIMVGAGLVTVATTGPTGLIPGNAGSVLITGVPGPGVGVNTTNVNFNGVFSVIVDSSQTFSYSITNTTASATLDLSKVTPIPTVFSGLPNLNFPGSSTTQGISINPITRTAALADANSTGQNSPQINLLSGLDQSTSSVTFFAGCTAFTVSCTNAPEFLGTTNLAWQPFTNSIVSYNPKQQQVSVSDPIKQRRYAIVPNPNSFATTRRLLGPGAFSITVKNGSTAANTLTLWGGIAVDPATNNAFVAESGSSAMAPNFGQIEIINLNAATAIKPVHVTEILVPSPTAGSGNIGGIPFATVPQATLTSTKDLTGLKVFGSGFAAGSQVLLDGVAIPAGNVQVVNNRQLVATIPATSLAMPHKFALQVSTAGVTSNPTDFLVIGAVDLTPVCSSGKPSPSGVAVADQIANGPFSPVAVVTNSGCNNIAIIDINPTLANSNLPNPKFGTVINNTPVGTNPQGIAVSQRFGLAVVANTGDSTASIIDLTKTPLAPAVAAVSTGTNAQPMGVAINDATGAALIANFGANTASEIDLSLLRPVPPATVPTSLTATTVSGIQQPIAVAIDPDRGPSNQGIAVVTALELQSGLPPCGALAIVDIGQATPTLANATPCASSISVTPTGIVFDPIAPTNTPNSGVFYASSSGANQVSVFNPDTGGGTAVSVGINPTALAYNPQTGALLTTNLGSQTASIVDMLSNPLKTRQTLGLPGSAQFGVAIDQFTNLAVIADQANNRLLLFPMPN